MPDATTLLKFRHLLEEHELTQKVFEEIGQLLTERKLLMREGTLVDAKSGLLGSMEGTEANEPVGHQPEGPT